MSIITKTGDDGTTGLMYNRRVPKSDPRVEAYGSVDELNAALGLARAFAKDEVLSQRLISVQKDLVILMGELATLPEDRERYLKDGYPTLTTDLIVQLETVARELEAAHVSTQGWAMPGTNEAAAALDLARTVGRRAERRVCALQQLGQKVNPEIVVYLNRLSDLLWLLARAVEKSQPITGP